MERTTVILREVSDEATEEDIKALFNNSDLGEIKNIQKEPAKIWFVTFDSEAHAKAAALQAMKKEVKGCKIRAGLRTERLTIPPPVSYETTMPYPPPPYDNPESYADFYAQYGQYYYPNNGYDVNYQEGGEGGYDQNGFNNNKSNYKKNNKKNYNDKGKGRRNRKYSRGNKKGREDIRPQAPIQELSFPPLKTEDTTGYKEPYISYNYDEIVNVNKNMGEFILPKTIEAGDHSEVVYL